MDVKRLAFPVGLLVLVGAAACADNFTPSAPTALVTYEVPLTGTVRDSNGMPIAGATVTGSVRGISRMNRTGETGPDGRFAFLLPVPLFPAQVTLGTVATGYQAPTWESVYYPGTSPQIDIVAQRRLAVGLDVPVAGSLSPQAPSWTFGNGRRCGPCNVMAINTDGRKTYVVSVTWTGSVTPALWLYGSDRGYDRDFEAIGASVPNQQRIEAVIPDGFGAAGYVGVPTGTSFADAIAYEVSVREQ